MNNDKQVAFRLPSALVEQIDAQVEDWSAKAPGMRVTRADVVRAILVQGLSGEKTDVSFAVVAPPANVEIAVSPVDVEKKEMSTNPRRPSRDGATGLTVLGGDWD